MERSARKRLRYKQQIGQILFLKKVRKLEELESYIRMHKHLPDMPSAKEVEANGFALGELNKKLLQKVEELSLYIIQQEKRLNEQEIKAIQQSRFNEKQAENISLLHDEIKKIRVQK